MRTNTQKHAHRQRNADYGKRSCGIYHASHHFSCPPSPPAPTSSSSSPPNHHKLASGLEEEGATAPVTATLTERNVRQNIPCPVSCAPSCVTCHVKKTFFSAYYAVYILSKTAFPSLKAQTYVHYRTTHKATNYTISSLSFIYLRLIFSLGKVLPREVQPGVVESASRDRRNWFRLRQCWQ